MPHSNPQNEDCPMRTLSHRVFRWPAQSHTHGQLRHPAWRVRQVPRRRVLFPLRCSRMTPPPNRWASVLKAAHRGHLWHSAGAPQNQRSQWHKLACFCNPLEWQCRFYIIDRLLVVGQRRRLFLLGNFSHRSLVGFEGLLSLIFFFLTFLTTLCLQMGSMSLKEDIL